MAAQLLGTEELYLACYDDPQRVHVRLRQAAFEQTSIDWKFPGSSILGYL